MRNDYYTYAYLREDGTPYYIGKGRGKRAFSTHRKVKVPARDRILLLKINLTEEEAFKHEIYMITIFGRKDKKTGILLNFTDGGEGTSGIVRSVEVRKRMSDARKGKSRPPEVRQRISASLTGKKRTKEHQDNLSNSLRGKKRHPSVGKRVGDALRGRKVPAEIVEKNAIGHQKKYRVSSKTGEEIVVFGLKKWAQENGYSYNSLIRVSMGVRKTHKDIISVEKLEGAGNVSV